MGDAAEWALLGAGTNGGELAALLASDGPAAVLSSSVAREILWFGTSSPSDVSTFVLALRARAEAADAASLDVLAVGVAALQAFVQVNWTGPSLPISVSTVFGFDPALMADGAIAFLRADDEEPYRKTAVPLLLVVAVVLLVERPRTALPSHHWWRARTLLVQQRILDERSATLFEQIGASFKAAVETLPSSDEATAKLRARLHVERFLYGNYYFQTAKEALEAAQDASGLHWQLTGALGRRTKFQENATAQLIVSARSTAQDTEGTSAALPKTMELNDDTMLDRVALNDDEALGSKLRVIDQCILLAYCLYYKRRDPAQTLTLEEMAAFNGRVLESPLNWLVHSMALLVRSRLEGDRARTVERAALQVQALVDQYEDETAPATVRLRYFFQLQYPPRWRLERELAERFMSIGALKTAMDIFERLEMWDEVVSCHLGMGKDRQAEAVVRERLEKEPNNPRFLCLLGDITKDPAQYEAAWEASGKRFSRAQRSLGAYYFKQGRLDDAITCLEHAAAINPLITSVWWTLGAAYMKQEKWEQAQSAFRSLIHADPEDAEAWSNLATVAVRLGRKGDALRALREATRHSYDNWKIWENILFVSMDVHEFSDAILAFNRLLDLRPNEPVDHELLLLLVAAMANGNTDARGQPLRNSAQMIGTLLDRLTARETPVAIWQIKATYFRALDGPNGDREADTLTKIYRAAQTHGWEKEEAAFQSVARAVTDLAECAMARNKKEELYSARMAVRGVVAKSKSIFEGTETHDALQALLSRVQAAEQSATE